MNPSATGWLKKHLHQLEKDHAIFFQQPQAFYTYLLDSGFIYANSISSFTHQKNSRWTIEELTKVNLIDALIYIALRRNNTFEVTAIVTDILDFYQQVEKKSPWSFNFLHFKTAPTEKLESIIHQRIQTNVTKVKKQFSHIVTNALIFVDVLAFENYLETKENPAKAIKRLEADISTLVLQSLESRAKQGKYDVLVENLLKNSLRYDSLEKQPKEDFFEKELSYFTKRYFLDLACVTLYNDQKIDSKELKFLFTFGKKLGFDGQIVKQSLSRMLSFFEKNQQNIAYFKYSNALGHFYNNTQRMVKLLIIRNKTRLLQELSESKELVVLLTKSTHQNLSKEERKKVKSQLLDICKSIPSLGIFILPGGSILLPILIKFIPQLLPSAFDENKLEE
ncbi:LETM1-related biofilm-associated protein [Mesonia sp. K7]|uniref:LETM1-related biofilm-associated protein n=1 Tax=Mesonia sp. K7 TaxID=2218606 RepID=UPI000DA78FD1|nr:LETM1-related biofilm-associated protein [Mesonia sp. K7]PZD77938.1 hypothetical protein DNG35_07550 [Mesonia sp. K7]